MRPSTGCDLAGTNFLAVFPSKIMAKKCQFGLGKMEKWKNGKMEKWKYKKTEKQKNRNEQKFNS
ncbi:MAG: hypothetical protein LBP22_15500 [Deltaproteobacteria bacterium]|nr:hypothetical protein [Deltaproteobacteria bacterium]